ncbi:hypothetical protein [Bifidobacterium callitrichidarum]|uniref:Uncharacterized protein n=1 Tax=Bifidobacterium callitrichidarum TaxID=2052941 RepID=A0A2U2NC89_9BIFI|nr:hypothetical protein [Bifidobacterium callitrichidarum]PWG66700.1 hypothetical protein DF196_02005 [Bifidobacterium callitrichidarum]
MKETREVTYKCGHIRPRKVDLDNLEEGLAYYLNKNCPSCAFKERHAAEYSATPEERAAEATKAAAWCAANGCCKLVGSEKQVAWAESIRYKFISANVADLQKLVDDGASQEILDKANALINERKNNSDVKWWINRRWSKAMLHDVAALTE